MISRRRPVAMSSGVCAALEPSSRLSATSAEQFAAALAHHRAGRFEQAECPYRLVRATDPEHVGSLHIGGLLAYQMGRTSFGRVVDLESRYYLLTGFYRVAQSSSHSFAILVTIEDEL